MLFTTRRLRDFIICILSVSRSCNWRKDSRVLIDKLTKFNSLHNMQSKYHGFSMSSSHQKRKLKSSLDLKVPTLRIRHAIESSFIYNVRETIIFILKRLYHCCIKQSVFSLMARPGKQITNQSSDNGM